MLRCDRQRQDFLLATMMNLTPALPEGCPTKEIAPISPSQDIQSLPMNDYGFTKISVGSAVYEFDLSFGTIRVQFANHVAKPKRASDSVHNQLIARRLHRQIAASFVPRYFLSSIFHLTVSMSFSRKITFATFNLRPGWSPIFKYCITGDIIGLQGLINTGLASPNDVDSEGLTALHVRTPKSGKFKSG